MFTTVKELHIEIEQRISQILSNRHRSIAPEFIDMVLNDTAIKYIIQKVSNKTNYKREGFEDTTQRVDEFQTLKKQTGFIPALRDPQSIEEDKCFIWLPSDYLYLISSDSKVKFSKYKAESYKAFDNISYTARSLDFSNFDNNIASQATRITFNVDTNSVIVTKDISDLTKLLIAEDQEDVDIYEFIEALKDHIQSFGYNAYWEVFDNKFYNKTLTICNPLGIVDNSNFYLSFYNGDQEIYPNIVVSPWTMVYPTLKQVGDTRTSNDLSQSETISMGNYYYEHNRHLNPLSELYNGRIYVYMGEKFAVTSIKLRYIKQPIKFNILLGQMSDLEVTPGFIDFVVSEMLLILKDESFNAVKQNSNLE